MGRSTRILVLLVLAATAAGCFAIGGGSYYAPSQFDRGPGARSADIGSALVGAAVSRSQGGCYAGCPEGTTCNGETGLCDELPCRGACGWNEVCEGTGLSARCVSSSASSAMHTVLEPSRPAPKASDAPAAQQPSCGALSPDAPTNPGCVPP